MQQIKQLPVFLGRKKRSLADGDTREDNLISTREGLTRDRVSFGSKYAASDEDTDNTWAHTADEAEDDSDDQGRTTADMASGDKRETITFTLNGQRQRFVVARQVDVVIDQLEDEEMADPQLEVPL